MRGLCSERDARKAGAEQHQHGIVANVMQIHPPYFRPVRRQIRNVGRIRKAGHHHTQQVLNRCGQKHDRCCARNACKDGDASFHMTSGEQDRNPDKKQAGQDDHERFRG